MRILYVPHHVVLEYDDIRMFKEMGFSVFSTGSYLNPENPVANVRPAINNTIENTKALDLWKSKNLSVETALLDSDFIDQFDVVISIHNNKLLPHLARISSKPVIIRTIGQSLGPHEERLLRWRSCYKIVRYSPKEVYMNSYAGSDGLIRFCKFSDDFCTWSPSDAKVVSMYQNVQRRIVHSCFRHYIAATEGLERIFIGSGNGEIIKSMPTLGANEQLLAYASARVYFALGTIPASYTLNLMEAMLTGCPVVATGRLPIFLSGLPEADRSALAYEVPDILANSAYDAAPDTPEEARMAIEQLLSNDALAQNVSQNIKNKAIQLFGSNAIIPQWRKFLDAHV